MKLALVVDDSNTMRRLTTAALQSAGFEVICGVDGKDALQAIGEKDLTIVATDYNMPNMNGVELVKALRSNPKHKFVPILLISTEEDVAIKQQAREAGASGWIKKPFEQSTLIAAISKLCGL